MTKKDNYNALKVVQKFFPTVTEVSDANTDETISVNSTDVKNSKRKDHNRCALAEAIKRQGHKSQVIVSSSLAYVISKNKATRFKLPEAIRKEIVSFDRSGIFEPGDYLLKAPPKTMRLGYQTGGHTLHKKRGSGKSQHKTLGIRVSIGVK